MFNGDNAVGTLHCVLQLITRILEFQVAKIQICSEPVFPGSQVVTTCFMSRSPLLGILEVVFNVCAWRDRVRILPAEE